MPELPQTFPPIMNMANIRRAINEAVAPVMKKLQEIEAKIDALEAKQTLSKKAKES